MIDFSKSKDGLAFIKSTTGQARQVGNSSAPDMQTAAAVLQLVCPGPLEIQAYLDAVGVNVNLYVPCTGAHMPSFDGTNFGLDISSFPAIAMAGTFYKTCYQTITWADGKASTRTTNWDYTNQDMTQVDTFSWQATQTATNIDPKFNLMWFNISPDGNTSANYKQGGAVICTGTTTSCTITSAGDLTSLGCTITILLSNPVTYGTLASVCAGFLSQITFNDSSLAPSKAYPTKGLTIPFVTNDLWYFRWMREITYIYMIEGGANKDFVLEYNPGTNVWSRITPIGFLPTQYDNLSAILTALCIDSSDNIFGLLYDGPTNYKILRIDASTRAITTLVDTLFPGQPVADPGQPVDDPGFCMAIDSSGNLYYTCFNGAGSNPLLEVGVYQWVKATGAINHLVSYPNCLQPDAVDVDSSGNLYFTDQANVFLWTKATNTVSTVYTQSGLTFGTIKFVSSTKLYLSWIDGSTNPFTGTWTSGAGLVAFDTTCSACGFFIQSGILYYTFPNNNFIKTWDGTTVATLMNSLAGAPTGIVFDSSGNMYVSGRIAGNYTSGLGVSYSRANQYAFAPLKNDVTGIPFLNPSVVWNKNPWNGDGFVGPDGLENPTFCCFKNPLSGYGIPCVDVLTAEYFSLNMTMDFNYGNDLGGRVPTHIACIKSRVRNKENMNNFTATVSYDPAGGGVGTVTVDNTDPSPALPSGPVDTGFAPPYNLGSGYGMFCCSTGVISAVKVAWFILGYSFQAISTSDSYSISGQVPVNICALGLNDFGDILNPVVATWSIGSFTGALTSADFVISSDHRSVSLVIGNTGSATISFTAGGLTSQTFLFTVTA